VELQGLSYDSVAVLSDFSSRRGITFPLPSGSITIKKYGILNSTVPESNLQMYGVPFPGTFVLNARGIITSRFFEQAYQERNTVSSIVARLGNHSLDGPFKSSVITSALIITDVDSLATPPMQQQCRLQATVSSAACLLSDVPQNS
jgi:hypothetical protein